MMDGRIIRIRNALDNEGFINVNILSYAVKYASSFYGPFRDAVLGRQGTYLDKRTYQMNICNIKEAIREVEQDIKEGADIVMIKPGMPYLDVIHAVSNNFNVNVFAYQVSGEYAMMKFAAMNGALDWYQASHEAFVALKRAGANVIFSYAALDYIMSG